MKVQEDFMTSYRRVRHGCVYVTQLPLPALPRTARRHALTCVPRRLSLRPAALPLADRAAAGRTSTRSPDPPSTCPGDRVLYIELQLAAHLRSCTWRQFDRPQVNLE